MKLSLLFPGDYRGLILQSSCPVWTASDPSLVSSCVGTRVGSKTSPRTATNPTETREFSATTTVGNREIKPSVILPSFREGFGIGKCKYLRSLGFTCFSAHQQRTDRRQRHHRAGGNVCKRKLGHRLRGRIRWKWRTSRLSRAGLRKQ